MMVPGHVTRIFALELLETAFELLETAELLETILELLEAVELLEPEPVMTNVS